MTILYKVHNNLMSILRINVHVLYFLSEDRQWICGRIRFLWLTREPEYDEIIADFANFDVASFDELVFCGFDEPTERIDVLLKSCPLF